MEIKPDKFRMTKYLTCDTNEKENGSGGEGSLREGRKEGRLAEVNMRTLKAHITSSSSVDYYECSDCGWVYPFPRLATESEKDLSNKEMAEKAFSGHKCGQFARPAKPSGKRT